LTRSSTFLVFLFAFVTIGLIGFGGNIADGFIEIKKGHETNSPKVCGDKLCYEYQEEAEAKKTNAKNSSSPLGQYKLGIPLDKIRCKINFILVLKSTNFHPACVKPSSAELLVANGWAAPLGTQIEILRDLQPKKQTTELEAINAKTINEQIQTSRLKVTITPDFINGQRFLNFEGFGWLGYHNVEIVISKDNVTIAKFRTETSDRGKLHVPWLVPDSIGAEIYTITLSDSKNFFTIDIPISPKQ